MRLGRERRGRHAECQGARHTALCPSLSRQEEDDYESPNEDQDGEDDGDYESPNEEEAAPMEDDADYEPPPSNDEEALQNSILPAKPFSNSNSMYIGKGPGSPAPSPTGAREAKAHVARKLCVLMLAQLPISCAALGKCLYLSGLQFSHL